MITCYCSNKSKRKLNVNNLNKNMKINEKTFLLFSLFIIIIVS